ncbi:polycystic kidney disease and receptor for egg jelly-related protein [Elysia marginata]|uniref:Polycystic kidney disease and receptor for egg jelly-related protein n=1 Tax=Elysia marginata TaxID=1093978 RepID=A0AAV4JZX0_9GAST|nr:polycystic kidney disease and receptor for egg jelly-related protein [Elysia marginata]
MTGFTSTFFFLLAGRQNFHCDSQRGVFVYIETVVSLRGKTLKFKQWFDPTPKVHALRCLVCCDHMVGTDQTFLMTIHPSGYRRGTWNAKNLRGTVRHNSGEYIFIKPYGDIDEKTYKLTLIHGKWKTTYYITVPPVPFGGHCSISPTSGTAVSTEFTVRCSNYKCKGQKGSLRYHLYRKDWLIGTNQQIWSLIAYGANPVMQGINLSSHKKSSESVHLKVKILSSYDSHTEFNLHVTVTVEDQKIALENVINNLTYPFRKMNRQENVGFISNVANVIFPAWSAERISKVQARNELLKLLGYYEGQTAEWVMQTAVALQKVTGREDEMKPHGVTAGIKALSQITDYLHKVGIHNIETPKIVAKILLSAVDRLMYKVSTHGTDVVKDNKFPDQREYLIKQNKADSKKGLESVVKITDAILYSLIGDHKNEVIRHKYLTIGVGTNYIDAGGKLNLGTHQVSFYMPASSLGIGGTREFLDSVYHVYEKNPFAFASKAIYGDLPLIYVEFTRRGQKLRDYKNNRVGPKAAKRLVRFFQPADIILKFQSPAADEISYKMVIDVENSNGRKFVAKSSCLFMSVPISASDITALRIRSKNNLVMEVMMSYTNDVKELNNTENGPALEIPLLDLPSTRVGSGTLRRDPFTLFLPRLTKSGMKQQIRHYRLRISIKTGVTINTPLPVAPNQGDIRGSDNADDRITSYITNITVAPFRMSCKHYETTADAFKSGKCFVSEWLKTYCK